MVGDRYYVGLNSVFYGDLAAHTATCLKRTVGPSTAEPNTARQQWQASSNSTPLEERPGGNVEKIQRRQGLVPECRRDEPPYGVAGYICSRNQVALLDSKRFPTMPARDGSTNVVRIRGGMRMVGTRTGSWCVRLKQWTNIAKSVVLEVRVDLLWARQP